jgi:thioredoxin reductase (NADPH)
MEDCIIIGAGPAGLTAGIYLARYRLAIRLFDCGSSRAALIPCTHNHAGFPEGISGKGLLARMQAQAARYGAVREDRRVVHLARDSRGFRVETDEGSVRARAVLLATGVVNHRPPGMDDALHDEALAAGLLRYCPVCDGYEVTDRRVGVIGTGEHGVAEAEFVRSFTRDVTLVAPDGPHALTGPQRARLAESGIGVVDGGCSGYAIEDGHLAFDTPLARLRFHSVYPALGSHIRSELALAVGAAADAEGRLEVSDHLETSVPGLFAAGDVVLGLDQISHAMGQAGVAATTIRNHLARERPLRR